MLHNQEESPEGLDHSPKRTHNGQQRKKDGPGAQRHHSRNRRSAVGGEVARFQHQSSSIQGLEIAETDEEEAGKQLGLLARLVRRRFVLLFLGLAGIALIVLAVLVVLLVVLHSLQRMDEKYTKLTSEFSSRSEQFMRLYEQLMPFRSSPYMTTDAMISKMSPEQLESAKAAGILPVNESRGGLFTKMPGATMNSTDWEVGQNWSLAEEVSVPQASDLPNSHGPPRRHEWHDPECRMKCEKDDVSVPPLVVISLDGFSRHYLDWDIVQTLDRMGDCGARAEFMFPSYPSKTFPNHYTIATGLWPEAHGITDNAVFDAEISPRLEEMQHLKNAAFYGGEPIWSVAVREHKRVFCLFWAGCSFNITGGQNPTVDVPYNKSFTFSERVDKIVEWLTLPAIERPSLVMAYFDQPDDVGHYHTSEEQVRLELAYLESVLDYLFNTLRREGILDCINLIFVSDHGMQWLDKRLFFDEMLPPVPGMITISGVIGHVYLSNTEANKTQNGVNQILQRLACSNKDAFHVYDRQRMPKRYHYSRGRRTGDVVLDARLGATFYPTVSGEYNLTSDHGYDYLFEPMHAIFFARGPNIRRNTRLKPFQNVELFNLFIDLLRLPHEVPNNGTLGVLDGLIQNMDLHRAPFFPFDPQVHPLSECPSPSSISVDPLLRRKRQRQLGPCVDNSAANESMMFNLTYCEQRTKARGEELNICEKRQLHPPQALFYTRSRDLCIINFCHTMVVTNLGQNNVLTSMVYESLLGTDFTNLPEGSQQNESSSSSCPFIDLRFNQSCNVSTKVEGVSWMSIAALQQSAASEFARIQFPMYNQFADGPFRHLQNLTRHYVQQYGRIVSITGTIFDEDMDGVADIEQNGSEDGQAQMTMPTHFFRILMRCEDDQWHLNGINCKTGDATRVLAFILPNAHRELNCLDPQEYLLVNSARVRDVELLTGVQFFAERMWFPAEQLWWRTNVTTRLWQ